MWDPNVGTGPNSGTQISPNWLAFGCSSAPSDSSTGIDPSPALQFINLYNLNG